MNHWLVFAARRLFRFVVSLFVLAVATFAMVHAIPGDPVRVALGLKAPAALVTAKRHDLGLDLPLPQQFLDYLQRLCTGRLGSSLISGLPVRRLLSEQLPATAQLACYAFLLAVLLAVPLGMFVGVRTRNGRARGTEAGFVTVTGFFSVIPDFLLAVGLVFVFAVTLGWFPPAGLASPVAFVLPVLALAAAPGALLSRIVRVETRRVLDAPYLRTARAKRLPDRLLYLRHALPNLLTSTLTMSGLILGSLLAGTVLVENIFAIPGVGMQLVQSVLNKDYPVVQALAIVFGGAALLIHLVVDIAIAAADPRSTIRER
ncbi:ABC transporter permease [Sciscionella marina]|uniref:ABC transporter permease n=1 Tax=Sciscionella marina TaxID=508770 RepID=UPI00036F3AEF|nr:ABC transporter permease [Sciscionella marina]